MSNYGCRKSNKKKKFLRAIILGPDRMGQAEVSYLRARELILRGYDM